MKRMAMMIDGSENDADSLRSATLFAALTSAHLDVYYALTLDDLMHVAPDGNVAAVDQSLSTSHTAAKAAFDEVCGGLESARWQEARGKPEDVIRYFGMLSDAVIVERVTENEGPQARAFNAALFETGSPVLVTPPNAPDSIGECVCVVWSGTPQSSRAIRSALPALKAAKQIRLLTNSDNEHADPETALAYLGLHGIAAEHRPFDGAGLTARGRGRSIIDEARAVSADLLVMGAFGESDLDGLFGLGRTTLKLVTAAPMPIFLHS